MDVRLQVRLDRFGRDLQRRAGLQGDRGDIGHSDAPRLEERTNAVRHGDARAHGPHGEHERQPGEREPLRRQVGDEQSRGVGGQRGVADQKGGVVLAQHVLERGGLLGIAHVAQPLVPQDDLEKRDRGARVGVESHAPDRLDRHDRGEVDRADAALRGDAQLRKELHSRKGQVLDRRNQTDVRLARAQQIGNAAGCRVPDAEDASIRSSQEAPGERLGIDVGNRGDSYLFHRIAMTFGRGGRAQGRGILSERPRQSIRGGPQISGVSGRGGVRLMFARAGSRVVIRPSWRGSKSPHPAASRHLRSGPREVLPVPAPRDLLLLSGLAIAGAR